MEKINGQEIYNFYNRKNKWLGMIDYKTLLVLITYVFFIFKVLSLFNIYYLYKVYIITICILPVLIFVLLNINEECVIDKLVIVIFFYLKRKIYIKSEYYAKLNKIYKKM